MSYSSINPSNGEPFFPLSMVEYRAATEPDTIWARIPSSEHTYADGFTEINYGQFQNAVEGVAQWLKNTLGKPPGEKIAYFGKWDPRYVWMVLGANKAGYQVVFPSLLFTPGMLNRIVMEKIGCRTVLTAHEETPTLVADWVSSNNLDHFHVPSMSYFLDNKHEPFPYSKSYEEAADDVLAIMYTSGSTHDAKPIVWTNSWAASFLRYNVIEPPEGWKRMDDTQQGVRLINILPVLHCGSLYNHMLTAPLTKSIVHYPLPDAALRPETFMELIEYIEADTVVMSPPFLEYIAADPARVDKVASRIKCIGYGGGPLSTFAGETLNRRINIFSLFACTENGIYPAIRPAGGWDPDRWRTITFHPKAGIKLDKVGFGTYEVVIERPPNSSPHDPSLPPALKAFPTLDEWRTEDSFTADPTEPASWMYASRLNDVIKYTDGTVFNPLPYEEHVRTHPAVAAALLYGSHRPDAVMLLEPSAAYNKPEQNRDELLDLIWPCIEEANRNSMNACNITKSQVIVTTPGKEIPRAYKGTTQRGKARILYEQELLAAM